VQAGQYTADYLRELQSQQRVAPAVKAKAPAVADPLGGLKLQGSFKPASSERSTDGLMDGLGRPQPTLMSAAAEALGPATTAVWLFPPPLSKHDDGRRARAVVDIRFYFKAKPTTRLRMKVTHSHSQPLARRLHDRLVRFLAPAYVSSKQHYTRGAHDSLRWVEAQAEDGITGAGKAATEQETELSNFAIPDAAAIKAAKAKRERLRNAAGATRPSIRLGIGWHMSLAQSHAICCDTTQVPGLTVFGLSAGCRSGSGLRAAAWRGGRRRAGTHPCAQRGLLGCAGPVSVECCPAFGSCWLLRGEQAHKARYSWATTQPRSRALALSLSDWLTRATAVTAQRTRRTTRTCV
jgi:hypothetical protein